MKILIVDDGKSGHISQAQGVQDLLKKKISKDISINNLTLNFGNSFIHKVINYFISPNITKIKDFNHIYTMIICVGKRTYPFIKAYKKKHPSCKVVYLMPPVSKESNYIDYCFYHNHKRRKNICPNMIPILGAPSKVTPNLLEEHKENTLHHNTPIMSFMIGGDAKNIKFTKKSADHLFSYMQQFYKHFGGTIIVICSRRTPDKIEVYLKNKLAESNINYKFFNKLSNPNPYNKYLLNSNKLVVTGESSSLMSEAGAVNSSKDVYIFFPKESFYAKRYVALQNSIINGKHAFDISTFKQKQNRSPMQNSAIDIVDMLVKLI